MKVFGGSIRSQEMSITLASMYEIRALIRGLLPPLCNQRTERYWRPMCFLLSAKGNGQSTPVFYERINPILQPNLYFPSGGKGPCGSMSFPFSHRRPLKAD